MRDEDIQRFVAELTDASQFELPTTAVDGWSPREPQPRDLQQWLREAFERCLRLYVVRPTDPPFGAAVIEDSLRGRLYRHLPEETGRSFLERLRDEGWFAADPWVFAMIPQVAGVIDLTWRTWAPCCDPRPFRFTWYFEARGRGQALRMNGSAHLTDEHAWLESFELMEPPRLYDLILRGHRARQRHRIRRS
jgi:hypothetical protein